MFVALVFVAGMSWHWLNQAAPSEESKPVSVHSPDYYLENFTTTSMNDKGAPKHRIKGDNMIHFIDEDSTEITNPVMTVYDDKLPPWVIVAESGWMSGDGDLLMLLGEVQMDRSGTETARPVHIDTHDLRVQPNDDWAETEREVFITTLDDRMKGVGMRALFSKPIRFQLLSKVQSHYANKP